MKTLVFVKGNHVQTCEFRYSCPDGVTTLDIEKVNGKEIYNSYCYACGKNWRQLKKRLQKRLQSKGFTYVTA